MQKNAMEHELQRSATAAAAAVQQAMRGRQEAESAARHSKTRLDAAAAEIQALQAQVSAAFGRAAVLRLANLATERLQFADGEKRRAAAEAATAAMRSKFNEQVIPPAQRSSVPAGLTCCCRLRPTRRLAASCRLLLSQ